MNRCKQAAALLFVALLSVFVEGKRSVRIGILLNEARAFGAETAIKIINRGDSDILKDVDIEYVVNYTNHDRYRSLESARWQIEVFHARAIVGPEHSSVTAVVAPFCAGKKIPLISPSATDPLLSDKDNYPFFARTVPSDTEQGRALFEFVKVFKWTRIGIVQSNDNYGINGLLTFEKLCHKHGVDIVRKSQLSRSLDNLNVTLEKMKEDNTKIHVINVHSDEGKALIKAAEQRGMMGPGYAWLCTDALTAEQSDLAGYARGLIGTSPAVFSGQAKAAFLSTINASETIKDNYVFYAADAVNLLARGIAKLVSSNSTVSQQFFWKNQTMGSGEWNTVQSNFFDNFILNASFFGVTGSLRIDGAGDRVAVPGYDMVNFQIMNTFLTVGEWSSRSGLMIGGSNTIVWPGNLLWYNTPSDRDSFKTAVKILTFEFDPFFYCKCGKRCRECNNTDASGKIIDKSKTEGFIVDMLSYLQKKAYLSFEYEVYLWDDIVKPGTYKSDCMKGNHSGCAQGWKCLKNGVCSDNELWYNVSGKPPLKDSGTNFVRAVGRGDFDVGAADNFVTESRRKIAPLSVPYMTTGVTLVRRRDTLEQTQRPPMDLWLLLKPFDPKLWTAVLLSYPIVMICLSFLHEGNNCDEEKFKKQRNINIMPNQYLPGDLTNKTDDGNRTGSTGFRLAYLWQSRAWKELVKFYNTSFNMAKWQTIEATFLNEEKSHHEYARFFLWTWEVCLFLLTTAYTASLTNFLIQRIQPKICTEFECMGGKIIAARKGTYTVDLAKDLTNGQAKVVEVRSTLDALWMVYNKTADGMIGCSY